ncbi:TPA: efflux RND transporter periplasmic adaptor subunit [Legionella pneumophila]|nr:efflux RND transporter periplasmic adaptor subunit [Legionella pneumophila]HCQ3569616.1 efflux RND transporter periplasmic adaptor subunit [Legionella pneumophila]HDZ4923736.1 efflux RND transporter periplasmic adaptor subunit [Legionella pneumophila]
MKRRFIEILALIIVFITGMSVYHLWQTYFAKISAESKRKILYWVAPMDPSYRRDKPGKSPMGMDLVPVYADQGPQDKNAVTISPAVENNLGVETAIVQKKNLARIINTVGYVAVDENNIERIHTFTDGWIKEQFVKTTGELVKEGQLLMTLYSPTLNNAQEELLIALKNNNKALIEAGKKKLLTLGMANSQINQLMSSRKLMDRVKIFTTQSGIVSKINVREGQYVKPDTELLSIEDLSQIWIIAEVFEYQSEWIKNNQPALAILPYLPTKVWQGIVDYVYPRLDPKTHTLRVRLTFPNPDLTLKPNMYANVKIISKTIKNALAIPRQSLIRTGDEDRVILALGQGRFKAQPVKVGIESGDDYQILSGLKAGDKVVTSAQFLIDSESNIKAATSRLQSVQTKQSKSEKLIQQEHVGMGTIKEVDHQNHKIIIHHQPIPSLGMDEMTMTLPVADKVSIQSAKPGDSIHFIMIKQGNTYLVTKIHIMNHQSHQHKDGK